MGNYSKDNSTTNGEVNECCKSPSTDSEKRSTDPEHQSRDPEIRSSDPENQSTDSEKRSYDPENQSSDPEKQVLEDEALAFSPPDGGYGWVVVAAACVAQISIVGFLKSYSLIYVQILANYPESSAYHASWIQAMLGTIGLFLAPVIGSLCTQYTTRKVSMVGGLLCFLGLLASAFATSVTQLIFTTGVITGVGLGLVTTPAILIVNLYFNKRRSMASAICVSGNSIGAFLMPPVVQYLLIEYQLKGTFAILAALQLHIVVAALFYRPPKEHALVQARQRRQLCRLRQCNDRSKSHNDTKRQLEYFNNSRSYYIIKKLKDIIVSTDEDTSKDKESREVSMYRCVPLTSSVTNMEEFKYSSTISLNHQLSALSNDKIDLQFQRRGLSTSNLPEVTQKLISTQSMNQTVNDSIKFNSTSILSTRGARECDKITEAKLLEEKSLRKLAPLRRFAAAKSTLDEHKGLQPNKVLIKNELHEPEVTFVVGDISDDDCSMDSCGPAYQSKTDKYKVPIETSKNNKITIHNEKNTNNTTRMLFLKTAFRKVFDPDVLKQPFMIYMILSASFLSIGAPHFLFYVHAHYGSVNLESAVITKLLSIVALVDLTGRLLMGFVADLRVMPISFLYFFCTALGGVCAICIPLVTTVTSVGVVLSGLGFGIGGWVVLVPTMLARNLGTDNLPASYGFIRMIMGIMNLISPQITGALVDYTGNYELAYYLMGTCITIAAFLQRPPRCQDTILPRQHN